MQVADILIKSHIIQLRIHYGLTMSGLAFSHHLPNQARAQKPCLLWKSQP